MIEVYVDTHREGWLSAVGHDLRIGPEQPDLALDGTAVEIAFRVGELEVWGTLDSDGRLDKHGLSRSDRQKIQDRIHTEVFDEPSKTIRIEGRIRRNRRLAFEGEVAIADRVRPIDVPVSTDGKTVSGKTSLSLSDFDLGPIEGLGGWLKVEDQLEASVEIREPEFVTRIEAL